MWPLQVDFVTRLGPFWHSLAIARIELLLRREHHFCHPRRLPEQTISYLCTVTRFGRAHFGSPESICVEIDFKIGPSWGPKTGHQIDLLASLASRMAPGEQNLLKWCPIGSKTSFKIHIIGVFLYLFDTLLVPFWHLFGTCLVPCWYMFGTSLIPFLVPFSYLFHTRLVPF